MASPLLSEAIIYGILIMTAASFQGFSMPTNVETVRYPPNKQGDVSRIYGSHAVGEPPAPNHRKLPLLGWSMDIGDLRIPHFIGIHSLQLFLILAVILNYLKTPASLYWMRFAALVYGGVFIYSFMRAQAGLFLI